MKVDGLKHLLTEVIEKQLYLNSEYRSSDLADGLKLNDLKFKQIKYLRTPLYQEIDYLVNQADGLVELESM